MQRHKHDYNSPKKFCSRCKTFHLRSSDNFHKAKRMKDGLATICKTCKKEIDRESKKNSPNHKAYQKSPEFVFSQLKYQAKKRGINFTIKIFFYLENLAFKPCFYCGAKNTKHWVDRYINNKEVGYTEENSVPCCERCNKMKAHRHPDSFLNHCLKVANFNK